MKNLKYRPLVLLALLCLIGCRESAAWRPAVPETRPAASPSGSHAEAEPQPIDSILTNENVLSYKGYTITKLQKEATIEGTKTKLSYAVLKKGESVVATFDRLRHPMGNATMFGLFPFLGGENKQLIVEQSVPRNWSHWIVNLDPDFKLIFDSRKWAVDGELVSVDVDHDGTFEFTKTLTTFYDFENLPSSQSPLVDILFKYDSETKEYVPANANLADYALKGIEDEQKALRRDDPRAYLSGVVRIVLRYIYAGKDKEAWAFYDSEYKSENKELIKSRMLNKLANEPVHRFIYKQ